MDVTTTEGKFVSRFVLPEEDDVTYGLCTWVQNDNTLFELQIYKDNESWSGVLSIQFAKQYCMHLEEVEAKYYECVKMALRGDNYTYVYTMKKKEDGKSATFSWKRTHEDGSSFLHCSVPLHLDDVPAPKSILIDLLINQSKVLKDNIENLTTKSINIQQDCENAKQELAQFLSVKSSLEKSLYSKFLQILNAKKRRIRLLEDNLKSCTSVETNE